MIKDRGNIKWQGMMLTEHAQAVREWLERDGDIERPQLDERDLQAIQYEIEVAFRRQCVTDVKFWDKGKVILYSGIITEINPSTMCISVDSPFGRDNMTMTDIVSVHIAE